jgi:hypothetical protein
MKGLLPVDNAQHDRGVKIRMQLDQLVDTLNGMDVAMSLVWVWVWDLIRDKYNTYKELSEYNDYIVSEDITLDIIWDKLWSSPPNQFTLEYGAEYVDEAITDWLIDNDFIVGLDQDSWLKQEA